MRYDADHKARTREAVLREASQAIRIEGPHKLGVAAVMARAGLTHGGFYAHFASKDDFIAAAIGQMFEEGGARMRRALEGRAPAEGLGAFIDLYVSRAHRDTRTEGCPLPFLSADARRLAEPSRRRLAEGIASLQAGLTEALRGMDRLGAESEAASMLSEMVGAVILARAEPDARRSDQILDHTRTSLKHRFGLEPQS